ALEVVVGEHELVVAGSQLRLVEQMARAGDDRRHVVRNPRTERIAADRYGGEQFAAQRGVDRQAGQEKPLAPGVVEDRRVSERVTAIDLLEELVEVDDLRWRFPDPDAGLGPDRHRTIRGLDLRVLFSC